jgi:hypothetical protein
MILDVTGLAETIGEIGCPTRINCSRKSLPVIYDSDEEPPSLPGSYDSTKSTERENNVKRKTKPKTGLFCCMVNNMAKKHLPTP